MPRKKKVSGVVLRPIKKVAVYVRVSTEEQAREGYGLAAQKTRCYAMATAKGWDEPALYADEGISGTKSASDRPGLQRLLNDCEKGEVDAVVILALDRLGRRTTIVLGVVDLFTSWGVTLVSCRESLDTSTPQGQFVLTMFAALAQLERDTIAERTTAALAERAAIDGERGGRLPFGYVRSESGLKIDRSAAAVVRRIFKLRAEHLSLNRIASRLNSERVSSPRGGQWYASGVREILLNESAYRGGSRNDSPVSFPTILKDA